LASLAPVIVSASAGGSPGHDRIARIPLGPLKVGAPFTFIVLPNLITLAGALYDWRTCGRVHPVWIRGGLAMLVSQLVMMAVMGTSASQGFAGVMAGLWA
jgi:hypothetical protein